MHIKPFQASYPRLEFITAPDSFLASVKEEYVEYVQGGFFQQTSRESLYIYQIRTPRRHYTGLVACVDIRDYLSGHIRRHEQTLPDQEQKQMQLMLRRKSAVKPVLMTYRQVGRIEEWLNAYLRRRDPFFSVSLPGEDQEHHIWEVAEPHAIEELQRLFREQVPDTYIADGHHRTSTTALMYEHHIAEGAGEDYSQLLSAFFPSNQLEILEFNRVVEALDECSPTWFMARIAQLFDIEILAVPEKPRAKHEIVMLINREWYRLRWKPEVLAEYRDHPVILDAVLLNEKVLQGIFSIDEERTDDRIEYVEGPRGLDGLRQKVVKNDYRVGFCLYPIQLDDFFRLVDTGEMMPPKSTWFEPRMKNGLIMKSY